MTTEPQTSVSDRAALRPGESPFASIKAVIDNEMERASLEISGRGGPPEVAVHSARKAMKRSRGLLRLIRDCMTRDMYLSINRGFRDAGRALAPMREASIRLSTFDTGWDLFEGRVDSEVLVKTRECFVDEFQQAYPGGKIDEAAIPVATGAIESARVVLDEWAADVAERNLGNGAQEFTCLLHGLDRVYRGCREGLRVSSTSGDFNEFHEWRKQVKYLRYQLEHLEALDPEYIHPLVEELHKVDECLGNGHDLWVLGNCIEAHPDCCMDREMREMYVGATDDRRREFHTCALQRGSPLFADESHDFVERIRGFWERER